MAYSRDAIKFLNERDDESLLLQQIYLPTNDKKCDMKNFANQHIICCCLPLIYQQLNTKMPRHHAEISELCLENTTFCVVLLGHASQSQAKWTVDS
jgi:hypothetical protein